jgi:hypothetical protein
MVLAPECVVTVRKGWFGEIAIFSREQNLEGYQSPA